MTPKADCEHADSKQTDCAWLWYADGRQLQLYVVGVVNDVPMKLLHAQYCGWIV